MLSGLTRTSVRRSLLARVVVTQRHLPIIAATSSTASTPIIASSSSSSFSSHANSRASSSTSSSSSSSQQDARALAQSQAPPPTARAVEPGWFGKLFDSMSIKRQQHRIQLGEEMFQAAFRQANDA